MASSAGNPNQPSPFDVQKLFKPPQSPKPNPNNPPNNSPFPPPTSYPAPPPSYPTPPPGPFSYPPQTSPFHHHPFLHYPQDTLPNVHQNPPLPPISYPLSSPHLPNPNTNLNNPGARLMALLNTGASNLECAVSMSPPSPLPSASSGEFSVPANLPIIGAVPSAPAVSLATVPQPTPARLPSSKLPRGRHLARVDRVVFDVDVRESQPPQLEVTPITKYISDPGLVLGRQIAVNRTYICYGLKLGAIRVLNINTALRSLLRGHTQRVTDMVFFAEDVHLLASASVDGRVFVWKINEGPDEEDKPQITGKIIIAIQIVGDGESFHPRVCWHSHKQEVLFVGVGNCVLKIDTTKVRRDEVFTAEEPLKCSLEKLIDGVQFVGKHDGAVTDLSMCQWMTTRLVSASKDGTVKIWEDRKAMPLVTLRPHDGQPVNSVTFLTSPHRPDHIVLITAGPLNREVKIWASESQEGWLLPSDSESWQCTQTLELRSSAEPRVEEAFFNQVVVLPQASLILLANAKKNAIYAVHLDYGPNPASTCMDYIAEFTVTMPILSLTGTSDCFPDGEQVVQVYCVQTQAIQQYALDLSQCLPPPMENAGLEDCSISGGFEAPIRDRLSLPDASRGTNVDEIPAGIVPQKPPLPFFSGSAELPMIHELATLNVENKPTAPLSGIDADAVHVSPTPVPLSPDPSGRLAGFRSPSKGFEQGFSLDRVVDQPVIDHSVDKRVEGVLPNLPGVPSFDDNSVREEIKAGPNDIAMVPNPPMYKMGNNTPHLITPSEILSGALSSSENTRVIQGLKGVETRLQDVTVNNDAETVEVEVKVVGESSQNVEFNSQKESIVLAENNEKSVSSQTTESDIEMAKECFALTTEIFNVEEARPVEDVSISEPLEQPSNAGEEEVLDTTKNMPEKVTESTSATIVTQYPASKGKKQKVKQSQASGPSSPSPSPFNSSDSLTEQGCSLSVPFTEAVFSQILSMQEMLNQLVTMQKEMQKQMSVNVAVPITKEGRRVEAALGRNMEKAMKANVDALWARFQEENVKHEKLERDRVQQITGLITNCMNKDLPAMLEKALKKEIATVGPAVARATSPIMEKTISSAIADSFQRGVGDKAVSQLEKSVNSKLEPAVARQIQAQFQTSGKQALQDALRSSLESSVIPAFELSCKAMFEQVDAAFQKGMIEHTAAAQQQESMHTSLALTLRDSINSVSSITQNLTSELADGQRTLLALVAAGNPKSLNPISIQQSNGPLGGLHEMVEAPLDPMKELSRLISEQKFEEAFTLALQRSDVSIVSWLCAQVDIRGICSITPLPLSQGVLLALLQQLACDLSKVAAQKLGWMTEVAMAINPADPMIAQHVRPIFEHVYQILVHQRSLSTTNPAESSSIRLVIHVINSVLLSCK